MRRGGAGRRDRIVDALDLEGGGQSRGRPRAHALRHLEGADLLRVLLARHVGGAHDRAGGGAARAHDDAGALVDDVARLQPGIADRLVHGDVVPADPRLHEAARLARDHRLPFQLHRPVHLAAESELGVLLRAHDAGLALSERGQHLLGVVADRGDNPHAGHDHASHARTSLRIVVLSSPFDIQRVAAGPRSSRRRAPARPARTIRRAGRSRR